MTNDPKFEQYEEEISKIDRRLRPDIENHGRAAYEYGVLIQKHLFLLYGGSLLIIPPLLEASSTLSIDEAFWAAVWIFGSIVLLTLCTYLVHLNWTFHLSSSHHERALEHWRVIERVWGSSEKSKLETADLEGKIKRIQKKIDWTFYAPHFFGIASLIAYVRGGLHIINGIATQ